MNLLFSKTYTITNFINNNNKINIVFCIAGTFCLYAGLAIIGFVVLKFLLPETKGKSLEEVEGLFAQSWCSSDGPPVDYTTKTIQYVHIRGLNRDGRESELDSPE